MKKVVGLSVLSAMLLVGGNASNAVEVKQSIDLDVGYTAQMNSGDFKLSKEVIDAQKALGYKYSNLMNQITLSLGYNAVFKVNSLLNPLVGVVATGSIPVTYTSKNSSGTLKTQISNIIDVDVKVGNEFNICQDLDIDIYGFVGVNIGMAKTKALGATASNSYAGVSAGAGVDVLYKDIMLGVYYKYTDMGSAGVKLNTSNNIGVKVGYRFAL